MGQGTSGPGVVSSMTGYAALSGDSDVGRWDWEIRAVNGKGLDLRLRLPDGCDAIETALRKAATDHMARGNVTVTLRYTPHLAGTKTEVDPDALDGVLSGLAEIEAQATAKGLVLATPNAAHIAMIPGVTRQATRERADLPADITAQIPDLLDRFSTMRRNEGAALAAVLISQLEAMAALIDAAMTTAEARSARAGDLLRDKIAVLLESADVADPARLHQELATLAVKADVTEEIDRLRAHVDAAHALLADGGAVGRKLDFLMQEFNREANTLCSKSGSAELTAIGLDLKVLIDQMREQVQNLE